MAKVKCDKCKMMAKFISKDESLCTNHYIIVHEKEFKDDDVLMAIMRFQGAKRNEEVDKWLKNQ